MGDDFFDEFGDKIDADWSANNKKKMESLFKKLDDIDTERIFAEMKRVIELNNKRKAIAQMSLVLIQEAIKLGLKAL